MKTLKQFIVESFEEFRCKDLEVHYNIIYNDTHKISFEVPEIYSEDDFQIYIQDLYFEELPGNNKATNDLLGVNAQKLFDTLFEYSKYEKSNYKPNHYINFKDSYDNNVNLSSDKFGYVTIENLEYIMKFDEFDLKVESEEDINDVIKDIFKTFNIKNNDELPFDLKLNNEKIFYE